MQIKQQFLTKQLHTQLTPIYVLIGQDHFLLNDASWAIKSFIKEHSSVDETKYSIQSTQDWRRIIEEANSYSLFSDRLIIEVFHDKKSIDSEGKKVLSEYLNAINYKSHVIIQAPNLQAKNIQWLSTHNQVSVVLCYPLNAESIKSWITTQLNKNNIPFDPEVPDLIHQYTQGNMLASAQAIEKIVLCHSNTKRLDVKQTLDHLSDQSAHTLYDLVDALLASQTDKAIHILRKTAQDKTEPTLVLWILAQELRVILRLTALTQNHMDFKSACNQLKIWPQRAAAYQVMTKKLNQRDLYQLIRYCQLIDEQIKSHSSSLVWHFLENLILSICMGNLMGNVCKK